MSGATRYVKWSEGQEPGGRGRGERGGLCRQGWKQRGEAVRAFYGVINFALSLNYKLNFHIKTRFINPTCK